MYHTSARYLRITFLVPIFFIFILQNSCKKDECTVPQVDSITIIDSSLRVENLVPFMYYTIHGINLIETQKVILNKLEINAIYLIRITDTTVSFQMPNMASNETLTTTYRDSLRLVKECGVEFVPVNILPPTPGITKISNEYAIAGDTLLLRGVYFTDLTEVLFPPDSTPIQGTILHEFVATDSCLVIVPEGVTEPGHIVLVSESGRGISAYGAEFRPNKGLIGNFDDVDTWDGWGGQVISSDNIIPPANGFYYAGEASGVPEGTDSVADLILPLSMFEMPVYSGHLTADYFSLEFEMFTKYPWQKGHYTIEIGEVDGDDLIFAYTYDYEPWNDTIYDGNFTTRGWETHRILLSRFRLKSNSTIPIQSYSQIRMANYLIWSFKYPDESGENETIDNFSVALDNFRISQVREE